MSEKLTYEELEQRVRELEEAESKLIQTENMLRDEKERLKNILDLVGDPIFVKDNDHRITHANRAFYDIFCMDENSVIGYTLVEAVPENERHHFLKIDRMVLDTGISDLREEPLTVEGLTRIIATSKRRFIDESGNKFIVGSIHDITELKQAEKTLLLEKNKLQKALSEVKTLSGLLPICMHCKKIRDDKGYWNQIEHYIHQHSDANFSHGICQECLEKYHPKGPDDDDEETQQ